jgi:ribosomal protein S18 acetylase RimI-like enzyme
MPELTVASIDHRDMRVAERLHAIQRAAYAQEARLLAARHFPPLDRTVADVQASQERFLGAFWETELVGTVSVEDGAGCTELVICSLTVAPGCQRRGVARALLAAVLGDSRYKIVRVSTGARNVPAIALYSAFGFVEHARRTVGVEELPLVEFRWVRGI